MIISNNGATTLTRMTLLDEQYLAGENLKVFYFKLGFFDS
jgi:hypothetical protein